MRDILRKDKLNPHILQEIEGPISAKLVIPLWSCTSVTRQLRPCSAEMYQSLSWPDIKDGLLCL